MRLLWLADALRSDGLPVGETSGWQTRGVEFTHAIDGVIGHHTASNRKAGNAPSLNTVIVGRPDLKGPLCNLLVGRDGSWITVASGVANHAGAGSFPGISLGNHSTIGIEVENDGIGEPWPTRQIDSLAHGSMVLLRFLGLDESHWCGHYEWARPIGRKIDPKGTWIGGGDWYSGKPPRAGWNCGTFRSKIRELLDEGEDDMFTDADRALVKETRDLLQQFFGIDPATGQARDIRAKIDAVWIDTHGADHRDLLAGRVKAIDRHLNPDAPQ